MSKGNGKWNLCKECSIMSLVMFNARREDFPIETIEETEEIEDKPKSLYKRPYFEKWDFSPLTTTHFTRALLNFQQGEGQENIVYIKEERELRYALKRVKLIIHPRCSFCTSEEWEEPFYTEEEIEARIEAFRERKADYYRS